MSNPSTPPVLGQPQAPIAVRIEIPAGNLHARTMPPRHDGSPISVHEKWMLLVLASYALDGRCCRLTNIELSGACGLKVTKVKELLAEMERDGLIRRELTATGGGETTNGRSGITLLKRLHSGGPVAATEGETKPADPELHPQGEGDQ